MTQKKKKLLLIDLCGRLIYGVKATDQFHGDSSITDIDVYDGCVYYFDFDEWGKIEDCKPYLRPMSSMGEKEREMYDSMFIEIDGNRCALFPAVLIDWLNAHHFDYRGLIEKGLALEAPEGMYKEENK